MMVLTILAGGLTAVLSAWLLVEMVRGRRSFWLIAAIPLLLAWPIGLHLYGSSVLGYATPKPLAGEFELVSSYADEQAHAVYATVRLSGERQPRLYIVTGNFEAVRKVFAAAQMSLAKGLPIAGRPMRNGLGEDGSFVFYQLPPSGVPEKG